MSKILFLSAMIIQFGSTASAGYVPPQDSPYWCYESCIEPVYYSNHNQCVAKCYGDQNFMPATEIQESSGEEANTFSTPLGAACCSWGDSITGCMPGC